MNTKTTAQKPAARPFFIFHLSVGHGWNACGNTLAESTTDRARVTCGRCIEAADNADNA